MAKKRVKTFRSSSRNILWALLVVAAAVTVYGFAQAATVSHAPSEIIPQGAGSGFDSDLLQGLTAADFLSASGSGDCGECPGTLPVCYSIDYDWDKDGKSGRTGDCDETCKTCYSGSTSQTVAPDGKDQDCDGTIDEALATGAQKSCPDKIDGTSAKTSYVTIEGTQASCSSWCTAKGAVMVSWDCRTVIEMGWNLVYFEGYTGTSINWDACTASGGVHMTSNVCVDTYICVCGSGYYQ